MNQLITNNNKTLLYTFFYDNSRQHVAFFILNFTAWGNINFVHVQFIQQYSVAANGAVPLSHIWSCYCKWNTDPIREQTPIFSEHICSLILTLSLLSARPVSGVINSNVIETNAMQETWPYFVLLWISEEHKAAHLRIFSAIFFCHLYIDSKFCMFL